jgi:predicted  nucleic acid-binding Zn-ribbon protein
MAREKDDQLNDLQQENDELREGLARLRDELDDLLGDDTDVDGDQEEDD